MHGDKDKTDKLYDTRIIERNMDKGLIDTKKYQKYLATLEDSSSNSELVIIDTEIAEDQMPKMEDYKG